jgi:hypothetical protein
MASPALRVVDLWTAGTWVTTDDDVAYVASSSWYMRLDADRVRRRDVGPLPFPGRTPEETFRLPHADETGYQEQFWFMRWSETLDNVSAYAYLDDDLVIVFQFWRASHSFPNDLGKVSVARIPPDEFVATVEQAADLLGAKPSAGDSTSDPSRGQPVNAGHLNRDRDIRIWPMSVHVIMDPRSPIVRCG